ncbi:hypothetical protein O3P69_002843 [Scylla paramamosain]|uniref:Uncharacterized protein n=1 Tax=Scylla paramamosain TaxID=85552 RepID=A0AAW0UNE2_SCYPA
MCRASEGMRHDLASPTMQTPYCGASVLWCRSLLSTPQIHSLSYCGGGRCHPYTSAPNTEIRDYQLHRCADCPWYWLS